MLVYPNALLTLISSITKICDADDDTCLTVDRDGGDSDIIAATVAGEEKLTLESGSMAVTYGSMSSLKIDNMTRNGVQPGYILQSRDADGSAQWVDPSSLGLGTQNMAYMGTSLNVVHNKGRYPLVQLIDMSTGEIEEAMVTHNTMNDFTISTIPVITNGMVVYN